MLEMMDFVMFWFAKVLMEIGLVIFFVLLALCVMFVWNIPGWIKQARCKHEEYYENMACHGICRNCHKDLGFVGSIKNGRKDGV